MKWFPHPLSNIYRVLDNVHMLWMGTAIYHNAITNTCVNPDVGSPLKFYITAVWQRMPLCCGWGFYPTRNGYHIPSNHMNLTTFICCEWAHGTFIMPIPLHVLTQMWEVNWNLYHCLSWATQDAIVLWLKLLLNMEWFPVPLTLYTRHWTMFICCGWAHESIIMPLLTHVFTQMLEVCQNTTTAGWQRR